jgi:hypothetical protein
VHDSGSVKASVAALPALLAVAPGQLLEARVRAQRRKVRAGIEGGKIVKSRIECFLQGSESFLFIAASRVCRGEPEIADGRRPKVL